MSPLRLTPVPLLLLLAACSDTTTPTETNEGEVITTAELTFTPTSGGEAKVFTWTDPEDDGSPVVDPIVLLDAEDYTLSVRFLDALSSPAEDLTDEIDAESAEHQVFFTGTAVDGPAGTGSAAVVTHAYDDTDAGGLPVGLASTLTTTGAGTGTFTVTLQHLPAQDGTAVKGADLAGVVASDGLGALPGDLDFSGTFDLTVE